MPVTLTELMKAWPPERRWTLADSARQYEALFDQWNRELAESGRRAVEAIIGITQANLEAAKAALDRLAMTGQWQGALAAPWVRIIEDAQRRKERLRRTIVAISRGDQAAIRPYLGEARRLWRAWQQQGVAIYDTGAPDGSVADVVQRRATWVAVGRLLEAEAARRGKSKPYVLNGLLAGEMISICTEWLGDLDALPLGALRVLPELAVESVARRLLEQPHGGTLIIECRSVRPVAVPRGPGRPRRYTPQDARLILTAVIRRNGSGHRLTRDDAADILDELCRETQPITVDGVPVRFPESYSTEFDIPTDSLRKQRRDRLDYIRERAGFASWDDVLDTLPG